MTEKTTKEDEGAAHALVLGGKSFKCANKMPFGQMLATAPSNVGGYETLSRLIRKVVRTEDIEDVWDAFDEVGEDEGLKATSALWASYQPSRPTSPASSSSSGQTEPDAP